MLESEHFNVCGKFVEFLDAYSRVLSRQLLAVEASIETAINEIMLSISELSAETTKYKIQAEKVLEQTYLDPSAETKELMFAVQDSVDDVIAKALCGDDMGDVAEKDSNASTRRLAGLFSKRMESMSTIDDALTGLMVTMMGGLSTGDVISQRIEHVARSLNALNLGLSYVLVDVNARFTLPGIVKLREDLMDYTIRQYGSEEERAIHRNFFANKAA